MAELPLDAFGVSRMASGHLCLRLSEEVTWENFPDYADALVAQIGGRIVQQEDGVEVRLWVLDIDGISLRLVLDDYPNEVCLEASDEHGDRAIQALELRLGALLRDVR